MCMCVAKIQVLKMHEEARAKRERLLNYRRSALCINEWLVRMPLVLGML